MVTNKNNEGKTRVYLSIQETDEIEQTGYTFDGEHAVIELDGCFCLLKIIEHGAIYLNCMNPKQLSVLEQIKDKEGEE